MEDALGARIEEEEEEKTYLISSRSRERKMKEESSSELWMSDARHPSVALSPEGIFVFFQINIQIFFLRKITRLERENVGG